MRDFIAIDFETANFERRSVCSVGIVVVQGGEITEDYYSLIRPTPNYYNARCTAVHGLCGVDTEDARRFPEVWEEIMALLPKGLPFVAHNSSFDQSCLQSVFAHYGMDYPEDYRFLCTYRAARRYFGNRLPNHQLHPVSAECGYDLTQHHNALADAVACAYIAMKIL